MAQNLGTIYAELSMRLDKFDKALKDAQAKIVLASQKVDEGSRKMTTAFGHVEQTLVRLGQRLVKWGAAAAAAATTAGFALGVKFNADMEQARIGFETMLGSAKKADEFLRQLAAFAARTPFEFPELREAASRMLAMGFAADQVIPTLTAVGDAAAALGMSGGEGINRIVTALGQMQAKAKVSAEEMMQLTEAGIPAWDILAKAIGRSTAETMKLASEGLIPADRAIQALVKGMEERFPNMMQKQAATFSGLVSTLKDNANMLLGTVFEPIFRRMKDILPVVIDLTERLRSGFETGGLRGALENVVPDRFKDDIEAAAQAIETIKTRVKEAADAVRESRLGEALVAIRDFAADLRAKISEQDWEGLGQALGEGVARALAAMGDIGLRVVEWLKVQIGKINWVKVGSSLVDVAIGFILGFVNTLFNPVKWVEILAKYWDEILLLIISVIALPEGWIAKLVSALNKIPLAGRLLAWLVESIRGLGKRLLEPISKAVGEVFSLFRTAFDDAFRVAGGRSLGDIIRGGLTAALDWAQSIGQRFKTWAGERLIDLGAGLGEKLGAMKSTFLGFGLQILAHIGEGLKSIAQVGRNLAEGLWSGLQSAGAWLKERVLAWAKDVLPDVLERFFGIRSPSTLMAYYGQMVAEGLAKGIEAGRERVKSAAETMAQAITGAVSAVQDRVSIAAEIVATKFELMKLRLGETVDPAQTLQLELQKLQEQLALSQEKVQVLSAAYERMKSLKGETATETQRLYLELLREQKAQVELANAIAATNKELEAQSTAALERRVAGWESVLRGVSEKSIQIAEAIMKGDWTRARELLAKPVQPKSPEQEQAERRARAWEAATGLPYGAPPWAVSPALWEKGLQAIRGLQTGGIVTRPTLALLGERGREAVVPLDRGSVIDYRKLADAVAQAVSRRPQVLQAEVHVHAGDVDEVRKIITLFERLPQVARAMGGA